MEKIQSFENKLGEIKFRKKLALQLEGKSKPYKGQPDKIEYQKILKDRVNTSRKIFKDLQKRGVPLSPFLEIGAERGQRSLLLVNEFKANGFATDISFDSLKLSGQLLTLLGYKKGPIRIVCDAYNLPFKSGSFPFVFCFQTLHHFPDPKPIVKEIKRVLAPGGYFYFGEEPVKQTFNLNLWRRDYKLTRWETILKYIGILPFISTIGKSEVSEGVLEETYDLKTWESALKLFDSYEVKITPYPFGPMATNIAPPFYLELLLKLLGGGIEGICHKLKTKDQRLKTKKISSLLSCPNCKSQTDLEPRDDKSLTCIACKRIYKKRNTVFLMLTDNLEKTLYKNHHRKTI